MSDLKQIAGHMNLDLDKIYINGTHHLKLAGWKSRARAKPFIVQCQNSLQEFVVDNDTCDRWFQKPAEKN